MTLRMQILKQIMDTTPEYVCIGLVTEDEIRFLLFLNGLGIIKHMLFLDCDVVECYIHLVWSDKE